MQMTREPAACRSPGQVRSVWASAADGFENLVQSAGLRGQQRGRRVSDDLLLLAVWIVCTRSSMESFVPAPSTCFRRLAVPDDAAGRSSLTMHSMVLGLL